GKGDVPENGGMWGEPSRAAILRDGDGGPRPFGRVRRFTSIRSQTNSSVVGHQELLASRQESKECLLGRCGCKRLCRPVSAGYRFIPAPFRRRSNTACVSRFMCIVG